MRGVLLDIDGTLLASNDAHAHSWAEAMAGIGVSLPYVQIRERVGKGGDKMLWELLGIEKSSTTGRHVTDLKKRIFRSRYLPELVPTPGARELLERMHADGLRLVVATSSGKEELETLLEHAVVKDLVDERVTMDDAGGRSKPDPDVVEQAIKRSQVAPADLMMLGDSPYDIEAAQKAGVATVALRCGGFPEASLAGAAVIYDDPADLLEHYASSPFTLRRVEDESEKEPSRER